MLKRIIGWSLDHALLVVLLAGLVALVGGAALVHLNIDAFPDITPVQVQINTSAVGLVPEEIERQVTFPVELAMNGMPGVAEVRSISMFGLSQVVVTFDDGTDIYFARQLIHERLASIDMPAGVARPKMGPVSTGLGEVFHYFLIGHGADLTELRTHQDWLVKPQLRSVRGVAEVNSWGGFEKQYQVRIDPTALVRHDLTFDQVIHAVRHNNLNVGAGSINLSGDMLLVHGVGRTVNVEQIRNIVVAARAGVPIRVRDLAEVTIGHEIRCGAVTATSRHTNDPARLEQGEVVLGLGFMLMGQNSYTVTHGLANRFDAVRRDLPADGSIEAVVAYDRTELVERVIATVKANLLEGATLVVLVLYLFLGNLRAGLVCALTIPLSLLVGFCGMWYLGVAGSLLSLGAIDFGVVVDSSVIMAENVLKRLGQSREQSAQARRAIVHQAACEVAAPACFGQLIILIVYLPLLTLTGVEGKMFRPMALTVMVVLVGSMLCTLTLVPVLCERLLPRNRAEADVWFVARARRGYARLLEMLLTRRTVVAGGAVAALGVSAWLATRLGSEFVPRLSEGAIVIGVARPPGTSLEEGMRQNQIMERLLCEKFPHEVACCWSRLGSPEVPTDASTVEVTDLFVTLQPPAAWRRAKSQEELVSQMHDELSDLPGQIIWFSQPIEQRVNEMVSGVRADVALKLFGADFNELVRVARQLHQVLGQIEGAADLATEQVLGQPILQLEIDQQQLARYGLAAADVLDVVEAIGGKHLGQVIEGERRFPLVARLPDSHRTSPEVIGAITVLTPMGQRIPLSTLCNLREISGPRLISRQWGERRITVQCNVRGRDVGSFVSEAQARIADEVMLPAGYRIDWGGQFENMQHAQRRLMLVVPLAVALIATLLHCSFRHRFDTLAALGSVPLACVGGIAGLALRGMPISISAAVGFITLSGIATLNSMVLINLVRREQRQGSTLDLAVRRASIESLRTILLTATVATVGFLPMAFSTGSGAEVQRPLATVVIGGVLTGTLYTLALLPILYAWCGAWRAPGPTATMAAVRP